MMSTLARPAHGTLVLAVLSLLPTTLVAQSSATAELRKALGDANPIVAEPHTVQRARVHDWPVLIGHPLPQRAANRALIVTQPDSSGAHPMAMVGDTLYAFLEATRASRPVRVVGRVRYTASAESGCGGGVEYPGWAYLLAHSLDDIRRDVPEDEALEFYPWQLPAAHPTLGGRDDRRLLARILRPIVARAAAAAVQQYAAYKENGGASAIHRNVAGPEGIGPFSDPSVTPLYVVRGPHHARLIFGSGGLADDLSDHGGGTNLSMLMSASGAITARAPVEYRVIAVTDLDGDGIDEIITREGVIRWDGHGWRWPAVYVNAMC